MPSLSSNELTLTIRAIDDASGVLKGVRDKIDGVSDSSEKNTSVMSKLRANWAPIAAVTAAAGVAFGSAIGQMNTAVAAANSLQGALTGLSSVSKAFGVDQNRANEAARSLAKDGLMTVTEAATGLKNLLASHFSLDQAIVLMNRFRDSAAFNRQASLGFGEAVATATEGIKNGNSILVDNAGVTKNLSVILQEAGYSQQDVGRAATDAGVRQALYNGIIKETNAQVGDASRLAGQFAGSQAKAGAATLTLQQNLGLAIQGALLPFLQALTPVITAIATWVANHQQLAAVIVIATVLFLGLAIAIGAVGAAMGLIAPVVAVIGGPVLAIIAGVGLAIAAVAALVITYWTPISAFFSGVFNTIGQVVQGVIQWISERVTYMKDHFWESIGMIIGFFATLPIKLPVYVFMAIGAIINWLRGIDWYAVMVTIGTAVIAVFEQVKSTAMKAWEFIKNINWGDVLVGIGKGVGNAIMGLIEGAINGALSGIPGAPKVKLPRFARGTNYAPGGLALVGEEGPELVNLPRGSRVSTAGQTRAALGSSPAGGVQVTQHIYNQVDYDQSWRDIGFRMRAAG